VHGGDDDTHAADAHDALYPIFAGEEVARVWEASVALRSAWVGVVGARLCGAAHDGIGKRWTRSRYGRPAVV
jgi:hypothetical protein